MKQRSFFDKYPEEYDWLTDEPNRLPKHELEVKELIRRFSPTSVLDAGCGTGLTSFLFAGHGVRAVGIDRADGMIDVARHKYASRPVPLEFRQVRFESLPVRFRGGFDLVVCLANALGGVETLGNLKKALINFRGALQPGGHLVLQLLNIASIKDGQSVIIRTTEHENLMYLRYLTRFGKKIQMTVIRIDSSTGPVSFEPFVYEHEPFGPDVLKVQLQRAGFVQVRAYSDLMFSTGFRSSSRDLVLSANKR